MKRQVRTSKTDPLRVATIEVPGATGAIGLTICPGKKDQNSLTGVWDRNLQTDITAISRWGAVAVVCLMEAFELEMLGVDALPGAVHEAGMSWLHLPIRDVDVPDASFEMAWQTTGRIIRKHIVDGNRVLIHCRGGLGRSGTIAARILIEFGLKADEAIERVRRYRPGAIETLAQETYVRAVGQHRRPPTISPKLPAAEDRAIGSFLGLAIGDALGTTLEFSVRDSLPAVADLVGGGPFMLKAGQWTDDTSMALCLADSLLACGRLDVADLMQRFERWRDKGYNSVTGHCFDIGITTTQAITRYAANGNPIAGTDSPDAAGNGSIMRLAPVAIYFGGEEVAAAAVLQSRVTHGAQECLDACRLMAPIIARLINGASWTQATDCPTTDCDSTRVKALAARKWRGKKRSQIKSTGYVVDTLEAAMWAVETTENFSDAVLRAVNLGGDADTVGAVAGQLAGARYGLRGIPKKWLKRLAWSDHIIDLARRLHRTTKTPDT